MSAPEPRDGLHKALLAFVAEPDPAAFDSLAARVVAFQAATVEPYGRLVTARGGFSGDWRDAPRVPTELFRDLDFSNLAPDDRHAACFQTSGTTSTPAGGARRGARRVRDLSLYHAGMVAPFVEQVLGGDRRRRPWLSLVPHPDDAPDSSLGHMIRGLAEDFADPLNTAWALTARGLDVERAEAWLMRHAARGRPLAVLATSFALVNLLDGAPELRTRLPPGSRLMLTGGFKGKTRDVPEEELLTQLQERLGISARDAVPEYGMTELSSQAYGRPLMAPPWLRLEVIDPGTQRPVPTGERGLVACFDLLNLDNVSALLTGDLGTLDADGGLTLHGRAPGAVLRGCSLSAEELGRLARNSHQPSATTWDPPALTTRSPSGTSRRADSTPSSASSPSTPPSLAPPGVSLEVGEKSGPAE